MIVLLRSTNGSPDSRLQKYVDVLERHKITYCTVCWDRECELKDSQKSVYFHKKSQYSLGWKNLFGLLGFNLFVFKWLFKNRKKIDTIHACDFDTILPAMLFKILFHCVVIYDVFDWYADSRNLSFLKYFVLFLEWGNLKMADITIVCEEERKKQLCTIPRKCVVLPNIPNLSNLTFTNASLPVLKRKIRLSYVGILSKSRGIENVLRFVSENRMFFLFDIAGFGELEEIVREYARKFDNIIYHGTVGYSKGVEIMGNSDLIMAIYELSVPNHIYAAPNKYYEGLFLGKPIVTTRGTLVGTKTEKENTGFLIDDSYSSLAELLSSIALNEILTVGIRAKELWKNKYNTYVDDFMVNCYIPLIKR